MNIHDYIAGLILIFIMILYLITLIFRFSLPDFPESVRYISPYEMKTGDIVCISYNNIAGAIIGSLTYSAWAHTGMIWVDPKTNIRYVLEGAICGQEEYKHFYKIPVVAWMNINRGSVLGYKCYNGPEINAEKMIEVFKPFMKYSKLEGFKPSWLRFLFNDEYEEKTVHKESYTCFESTIILGQQCGIYSKSKKYSSYFPCHIVNDKIEMPKGTYYSKVVQIKQNVFEQKLLLEDIKRHPEFWKAKSKKPIE